MKKKYWAIIIIASIFCTIIFVGTDQYIDYATNGSVYNDSNLIPYNKVGLLLGTSKYVKSGKPNQYFIKRIAAAVALLQAEKISYIVVSGDNSSKNYNEPLAMKKALIKAGVPQDQIYLDFAGFRTYDSIVRINKVFGQTSFTVISQEFQNRRAIYIAKHLGLQAVGYNAEDIDFYHGFKTKAREKLSRIAVFIDLLLQHPPRFLGTSINIE